MIQILTLAILMSLTTNASANNCKGCEELKKIEAEYSAKGVDQGKQETLQLKGAQATDKMTDGKSLKLSTEQVKAIVSFMRVAVPKDPSRSFTSNIDTLLRANRKSFEKEFALLPKAEASLLSDAVSSALDIDSNQDPTAGQDKLEAQPANDSKNQPANR